MNELLLPTGGLKELHLFAGAGGGLLGGILLGHTTVCAVEIEPYCREVLLQRQRDGILPKFPIWDDVKTFSGIPWRGKVDIVCGGFPCQDISCAGKGAGLGGERSGLWSEFARIIGEVRPEYALIENSPVLAFNGGVRVIADLASMGFDARWGMFSAKECGGDFLGIRMWIVAKTATRRRGKVLCDDAQTGAYKGSKKETANVAPCSRLDRIRALEQVVGEPWIMGSDNGLPNRVDRINAVGNAQFPKMAKLAWETLTQGL